jgi:1-acyl-sn-glycerol-3-phosphate acyltransferase
MIERWLRSALFTSGWYLGTAVIALVGAPLLLTPRRYVRMWAVAWTDFTLWWLRLTVGLTHRISGLEHLPPGPAIIAIKHQSSWETVAVVRLFPDAAIVMKRELLFIPIVGMAMLMGGNIAIERGDGAAALRSLVRGAKDAVANNRSILIFPEGTRTPVGADQPYPVGVAALYRQLGIPVVPVALNSGVFWGRRQFVKRPGVIDVEALPAIPPGLDRKVFMATLRDRIEQATAGLVGKITTQDR